MTSFAAERQADALTREGVTADQALHLESAHYVLLRLYELVLREEISWETFQDNVDIMFGEQIF